MLSRVNPLCRVATTLSVSSPPPAAQLGHLTAGGGREAGLCLEAQPVPLVVWRIQALAGCHTRASVSCWPSPGSCPRLLAGCGMVSGSNDGQALCDAAARGEACPARLTWLLHGTSSSGLLGVEMCTLNLNRAPSMHQPGTHSPRSFPPPPRALLRPCWLFSAWSWARGESRPCPPVQ